MRVLHVITGLRTGGAETQLELLLGHYRHEHEVIALYDVGAVGRRISGAGITVRDLGMRSNRQPTAVLRLARLIHRGCYDAVHVHLFRACVYGRIAARLAGVPVVVTTEHSLGDTQIEGREKSTGVRRVYLATDRLSDATVAVSPRVRERLLQWGVPAGKIRVVPNAVDFARFAFDPRARSERRKEFGVAPAVPLAGCVGRLHPFKRYDLLLRSAGPLFAAGGRLLFVGGGEERTRLEEMSRDLGYGQRVIFAGAREDVPSLLSAMDVFISPSAEETFGLSTLEALASGLPAVVTACPALDGLRLQGVERVVEKDNDPEVSLQSVIRRALRNVRPGHRSPPDPLLRYRYDAHTVAATHEALYEELLAGRRTVK